MFHDSSARIGATRRRWSLVVALALSSLFLAGSLLLAPAPAVHAVPLDQLRLSLPVNGELTRGFDPPSDPWGSGHRGVDLAAAPGTVVRAAADGTVSFAGTVADRGVLSITHDAASRLRTTYEPVRPLVAVGAHVVAGQPVAVLTSGGSHAGSARSALHWGLVQGRTYLDPVAHLGRSVQAGSGPIVLLPQGSTPRPQPQLPATLSPGLPLAPGAPGRAVRPAPGPISSRFGMRLHPILRVWKLHDGTDIAAACGTPVRTMFAGRVVDVEHGPAYGIRVIVQHADGRRSGYAHLSSASISTGQSVAAGQLIGAVGTTGWSTGCHLHVMGWQGGQLVDVSTWW